MRTFVIEGDAEDRLIAWMANHAQVCKLGPKDNTAIGGRWTLSFTQTSLGTIVKACCACGEEKDLTDYQSW